MKRIFLFISIMSLTAVAADPQAARLAQEARARQIAGEQGEALPMHGQYSKVGAYDPRTGTTLVPAPQTYTRPRSATQ